MNAGVLLFFFSDVLKSSYSFISPPKKMEFSGCRVKPPAASGPPGLHTTARELQTCTFERPGASNTTKIPRENPQREREERMKFPVGERKKRREILGPPTLRPPHLRDPTPSGLHPSGPPPQTKLAKCGLAKFGQQKLAKFGQIRMAKSGLAKFGRDRSCRAGAGRRDQEATYPFLCEMRISEKHKIRPEHTAPRAWRHQAPRAQKDTPSCSRVTSPLHQRCCKRFRCRTRQQTAPPSVIRDLGARLEDFRRRLLPERPGRPMNPLRSSER